MVDGAAVEVSLALACGVATGPPFVGSVWAAGDDAPTEFPFWIAVEDEGVYPIPLPEPTDLCDVAGAAPEVLIRLPTSVFRLLSSVPSSLSLVSLVSLWASSAFGIMSRKLRISSAFRLASSSLLRSDSFSEANTDSNSPNELSRRVVRLSSAALSAAVSVFN
jgi:hypothetical protein